MCFEYVLFLKEDRRYCTYKEPSTDGFKEPWTPDRFSMLDLCPIPDRWKNIVKDVESKPGIAINSDHAMIVAKIKLNLKGELKKKTEGVKRYRSPKEQHIELYNKEINEKMSAYSADNQGNPSEQLAFLVTCLADSANNNLTEISPLQKK